MTNPAYMICILADSEAPVPSIKRECCQCHRHVWLSLISKKQAEENRCKTICLDCLQKTAAFQSGNYQTMPPTEEQIKEIIRSRLH